MAETFHLTAETGGERLDTFIAARQPALSRSRVKGLIQQGSVTVNDRTAKPGTRLEPGDRVNISIPPPTPTTLRPHDLLLKIIYEDDDIIVIDKPAGLTVHPAAGHASDTLVNALISRLPALTGEGGSLRPGIVHRLDKDTSGVIVVARTPQAQTELMEQFRSRQVEKTYIALVVGKLTPAEGIIDAAVGRHPGDRKRMAVVSRGRESTTRYRVLKYLDGYTLLEVKPRTGRTHQIRVHLAAIGFPVAGDAQYGARSPLFPRHFLHAARLRIRLPATGEWREFASDLPEDLQKALEGIADGVARR